MTKIFFGVPIIAAVVAGISFPYTALSLMPFGFVFLFLLMLLSGFSIDWGRLPSIMKQPKEIMVGLFFLYLVFPTVQLFLAKMLIADAEFLEGIVFASLMPVALVAPYFTREFNGDEEFSFLLMVLTMLLTPMISPLLLKWLTASILPIQALPLMKIMVLLVTVPLLFSFLISRYLPKVRQAIVPYLGGANMVILSLLIFILFGTAVGRVNLNYEPWEVIVKLFALAFFQDFGVFFLARIAFCRWLAPAAANGLIVSLSMKNVAIAAGILLFYDPRASLAPALVFIAHACLFSFLPAVKTIFSVKGRSF